MITLIVLVVAWAGTCWTLARVSVQRRKQSEKLSKGLTELLNSESESFNKLVEEVDRQRKDLMYIIGFLEYLKPMLMSVNINTLQEALAHFVGEEDYETAEAIRKQLELHKEVLANMLKQTGRNKEN